MTPVTIQSFMFELDIGFEPECELNFQGGTKWKQKGTKQ
jgi:hypothetical protein